MTSLSLPAVRRRFIVMLWLSAALHALVIGLTRLPSSPAISLPPELEVQLAEPAARAAAPVAQPEPQVSPAPVPQTVPSPSPPQPVVKAPVQPSPQPASAPPVSTQPAAAVRPEPAAAPVQEAPGPQINIPLVADTRYYSTKELDSPPSREDDRKPAYPPQAQEQGITGSVVLRLHLEADGQISRVEVIKISPNGIFGEMFKQSALDSTRGLRFKPARRNGQPVRALVEYEIVYKLDDKD